MSDKPMLFSGPMVRAILDGTKTQTRRLLKPQPAETRNGVAGYLNRHGYFVPASEWAGHGYAIGDRLWVRETFYETEKLSRISFYDGIPTPAEFRADWPEAEWRQAKWTPAIFMRRELSRITLTVTDVRVQRLQEISEADARVEGAVAVSKPGDLRHMGWTHGVGWAGNAFDSYRALWDRLNAKRAPWASNPWVVALTFTATQANVDRMAA